MENWDTHLPERLERLHQLPFDFDEGYDFEPYPRFLPAEENAQWFQAWTGNDGATGAQFRVFGQDGSGGYAAFWLVLPQTPIEQQPIVFFGSEGELGVVAHHLDDYLWLLAGGAGPCEALEYAHVKAVPNPAFKAFALQHASTREKTIAEVVENAQSAFPGFAADIESLCRH